MDTFRVRGFTSAHQPIPLSSPWDPLILRPKLLPELLISLLLSSWKSSLLTLFGRFDLNLLQESSLRLYSSKAEPDPLLLTRIFRPMWLLEGSSADCENFSVGRKACLILYVRLAVCSAPVVHQDSLKSLPCHAACGPVFGWTLLLFCCL